MTTRFVAVAIEAIKLSQQPVVEPADRVTQLKHVLSVALDSRMQPQKLEDGSTQRQFSGQFFWEHDGSDLYWALLDSGSWKQDWIKAGYWWKLTDPQAGVAITYTEGDIDFEEVGA